MNKLVKSGAKPSEPQDEPLLVPALQGYQRAEYIVGVVVWFAAFVYFWIWWLQPDHHISVFGSIVATSVLAWLTLLPAYFLIMFYCAVKPNGPLRIPHGSRIAMVVTKAPSEPFAIVEETLLAMLAQTQSHDTWLADEDPSPETLAWCREHGVFVSTRKDRADYHRQTWPRRTRCKEGNLAFFYDHYGYERYDFVSQLDADHVPEPDYLYQMLRPFADPAVGYVSAPSICDRNAVESWSARGRLFAEANFHGCLQAGYSGGFAPMCIGSHYAVRTTALKEIGGLGPELAEDHSTTLMMNAYGWRGVHAIDAIAHGDGPRTFGDLVTQEFQWARSIVMILLQYSPGLIPRLSPRLRFSFLFSQFWYPLSSLLTATLFAMPVIALVRGQPFVAVTYPEFLTHFLPLSLILLVFAYRWRATGTFRPVNGQVLSWESILFLLARWPWALAGTLAALRDWMTGSFVDFRVTPKGTSEVDPLPFRVLVPYGIIALGSVFAVLFVTDAGESRGFYLFAIFNSVIYAVLMIVVLVRHSLENKVRMTSVYYRSAVLATILSLVVLPGIATAERGRESLEVLALGAKHVRLFDERYLVSGAGVGGSSLRITIFRPHWRSETSTTEETQ